MFTLKFRLFGKFSVESDSQVVKGFDSGKERELLSYLLLRRDRSHPREALASLFWGDSSTEKSKKYLRQALWHLQAGLEAHDLAAPPVLLVQHDWVQLNSQSGLWLDVAVLEHAFAEARGKSGQQLDKSSAEVLREAVKLYKGELLDGCYHDWCLFERERLQNIYLCILDKLMCYCQHNEDYEAGLSYGSTILSYDRASERTYRQLMHLLYRAGDRTGALRQYERCVNALKEELGVKPERRTRAIYENIRADEFDKKDPTADDSFRPEGLPEVLGRIKRLQGVLEIVQRRLQRDINYIEHRVKTLKQ
jgi:DNA-binding SARP family transcriptional activator